MKQKCALLGNVTGINRELYNIVYEGTVSLVEEVDAIPEFEVLFAGIPVQSFLVAGKGAVKEMNPFNDLMSVIRVRRPNKVVIENVYALQLYQKGRMLERIKNALVNEGYKVSQEKDLQTRRFYVNAVAA